MPSCKENTEIAIFLHATLTGATLICLHPKYDTPFMKANITKTQFRYEKHADHDILWAIFGDLLITDMTRHPNTIKPHEHKLEKMSFSDIEKLYSFTNLTELKSPKDSHSLDVFMYTPNCPERPNEGPEVKTIVSLKFGDAWANYIDELTLKRILDYVTEQLVYSFIPMETMYS